jgi:hypothetical protein
MFISARAVNFKPPRRASSKSDFTNIGRYHRDNLTEQDSCHFHEFGGNYPTAVTPLVAQNWPIAAPLHRLYPPRIFPSGRGEKKHREKNIVD